MTSTPNHDDHDGTAERSDKSELRQDYPGGRPVGHHPSPEREADLRGHAREAQPYDEAPAEGPLAPETDWEDLPPVEP